MELVIDKSGKTLWELHCELSDTISIFRGFSANFKFNESGKIIQTFPLGFESCRFKKPQDNSPYITELAHNPYFGTSEWKKEFTTVYPIFDARETVNQIGKMKPADKKAWKGAAYYFGKTTPLFRFYPMPDYWSAEEAILADHKLQEFNNEELENGFFQSVLINAIGDPNAMSTNPATQKEIEQTDGTKKKVPTETVSQEFNRQMGETFSGSKKAATAMVLWSKNSDTAIKLQAFPVGINSDRLIATHDSTIKTITIATQVPSILANISEGVSLGSGGSEMQKAVELMQSRTIEWRSILENFYNKVLFPNMETPPSGTVKIQNFNPITVPVEPPKEVWAFLNEAEKIAWIQKNLPDVTIIRAQAAPVTPAPATGETTVGPDGEIVPPIEAPKLNEAQKSWGMADINKIQKIVSRYNLSLVEPGNSKALTFDQAKQILMSYGLTDQELNAWIVTPEEITV